MEPSQAIRLSMRHVAHSRTMIRIPASELHSFSPRLRSQINGTIKSSNRSFTTSIPKQAETSSAPTQDKIPQENQASSQAPAPQPQQPQRSSPLPQNTPPQYSDFTPQESAYARTRRPLRPIASDQRIDLSTVPGIGASYTPPPRRDPITAAAKLNEMLRQNRSQQQSQPSSADYLSHFSRTLSPNNSNTTTKSDFSHVLDLIPDSSPATQLTNNTLSGTSASASNPTLQLRLRPTLGRTVSVNPAAGTDLTRAFLNLERKCNANSVKSDLMSQRFHVRRGQKKKLERSRRWRIVFKQGFLEECKRVRRMMRQGW